MMSSFAAVLWQILSVLLIGVSSFPKASCVAFHRPIWTGKEEMAEREGKFLEIFADTLQKLVFLIHKGVSRHIQLFGTGALGQSVCKHHKNLIAFRV